MERLRGKAALGKISAVSPLNFADEVRAEMQLPKQVKIVDMSLKEGLQMEGMALSQEQCLVVARELDELGVPSFQVALRVNRDEDKQLIDAIGKMHLKAELLIQVSNHQHPPLYSQKNKLESIDKITALGCVPFVNVALSNTLLRGFSSFRGEKGKSLEDLISWEIERGVESVERAKKNGGKLGINMQDPMRCELSYLDRACKALADAGAYYIVFDDIAMPGTPTVFKYIMKRAKKAAPHGAFGNYVHDDYGFGLGAALASIEGGAEVQLCTINGYGKRGGMVDLAQLAVILEMMYGFDTGIKLEKLCYICKLFEDIYGRPVLDRKAITGTSAFAHGADWHVQWAFNPDHPKDPAYQWVCQTFPPEMVGGKSRVTLYSGSGEMGIRVKAGELGITLTIAEAEKVRPELRRELVIRRRPLRDEEFISIIRRVLPDKVK